MKGFLFPQTIRKTEVPCGPPLLRDSDISKTILHNYGWFEVLLLALLILPFSSTVGAAQDDGGDRYRIHVLNMDPGDHLFTRFGHIALLVEDRHSKTKSVYNFGEFDFDDPSLRINYLRGLLNYRLAAWTYDLTQRVYRYADMTMALRTLNLSPGQAAEIVRRLEINARPENRDYSYRHYTDNCCTRIRDLLDEVTAGSLSKGRKDAPTGLTYRDWTRNALRGLPLVRAGILLMLGPAADKPITRYEEQFLPEVLARDLDETHLGSDSVPLVLTKEIVLERQGPPVRESIPKIDRTVLWGLGGLFVAGFVLPIVLKQRRTAFRLTGIGLIAWGLVAGLAGLVLVFLWAFTTHHDTHYNENILVFPFLHLWLIGPGVKLLFSAHLGERTTRFLKRYLLISVGLILLDVALKLGPFIQENFGFIALGLACNIFALAAITRTGTTSSGPGIVEEDLEEAKSVLKETDLEQEIQTGLKNRAV